MAIKKLGTLFINTNNPANMHVLDINVSIDIFNAASNLQNLLALQRKVNGYGLRRLSDTTLTELHGQIDREFETIKMVNDLGSISRFVEATVNCRAGGRTLQISGGGGDDHGEGGGYSVWKEHGFEPVCERDAFNATKFEEVAQELSQKVTEGALSTKLAAFLNKVSTLNLEVGGKLQTFNTWVRGFRGKGICAQKTSSDGKQWLLSIVKEIPHIKQFAVRYTLELENAAKKGEKEYGDFLAERLKRRAEASKNLLGTITMPDDWQTDCFNYGDDSGNWVLQEFIRINKGKPLPVVSKQFPLVMKAIDDYLLPQLAGGNWRNLKTPDFKKAWADKDKPNQFE